MVAACARTVAGVPLPVATLMAEAEEPSSRAALRVWRLRCRGGHTGLAFEDAADAARYEEIVLAAPQPARGGAQPACCGDEAGDSCHVCCGAAACAPQRRRFDLAPDPLPPRQQGAAGAEREPHVVGIPHLDRPSRAAASRLRSTVRDALGASDPSSRHTVGVCC